MLRHFCLCLQVTAHVGDAELEGALKGADLVVIPAGEQQRVLQLFIALLVRLELFDGKVASPFASVPTEGVLKVSGVESQLFGLRLTCSSLVNLSVGARTDESENVVGVLELWSLPVDAAFERPIHLRFFLPD